VPAPLVVEDLDVVEELLLRLGVALEALTELRLRVVLVIDRQCLADRSR